LREEGYFRLRIPAAAQLRHDVAAAAGATVELLAVLKE
jgi:hypothetical protein